MYGFGRIKSKLVSAHLPIEPGIPDDDERELIGRQELARQRVDVLERHSLDQGVAAVQVVDPKLSSCTETSSAAIRPLPERRRGRIR